MNPSTLTPCPQCDTPYCATPGECRFLDIRRIPKGVHFYIERRDDERSDSCLCAIDGVLAHAATPQAAIEEAAHRWLRSKDDRREKAKLIEISSTFSGKREGDVICKLKHRLASGEIVYTVNMTQSTHNPKAAKINKDKVNLALRGPYEIRSWMVTVEGQRVLDRAIVKPRKWQL